MGFKVAANSADYGGDECDNSITSLVAAVGVAAIKSATITNLGSTGDITFVVNGALGLVACACWWRGPLMFSDFACIVTEVVGGG